MTGRRDSVAGSVDATTRFFLSGVGSVPVSARAIPVSRTIGTDSISGVGEDNNAGDGISDLLFPAPCPSPAENRCDIAMKRVTDLSVSLPDTAPSAWISHTTSKADQRLEPSTNVRQADAASPGRRRLQLGGTVTGLHSCRNGRWPPAGSETRLSASETVKDSAPVHR